MDNLTHSLIGVSLSRAGLNRLAPDATAILLVAANAPDVDVLSWFGGAGAALQWHRSYTHSLAFSPLMAVASVALIRIFTRRKDGWLLAWLVAWIGVLSHLALDLTNNYGVRLWLPFSRSWIEWDTTYVIDPYIWAILLLGLFAPFLARLVSSEIGERKRVYPSRVWPGIALGLVLFYDFGRALLHMRAVATLNARMYESEEPIRAAAFPTPLSPLVWHGLVETSDRDILYSFTLVDNFDPSSGKVFYRNDPGAALPALAALPNFGRLIAFDQYPLWRVINDENNARYRLTDLRFGDPVAQTFTCSARLASPHLADDERCDFTFSSAFSSE